MSKFKVELTYEEIQIIKNAITHYTWRLTATKKELDEENRVLHKLNEYIEEFKENIK